jgi:hypothetical protein
MKSGWESTNAPMMIIATKEFGHFGIDPLGDTWVEAEWVHDLWRGQKKIPAVRSFGPDRKIETIFVSLDWLIEIYPDKEWLQTARDGLRSRVAIHGFEADE